VDAPAGPNDLEDPAIREIASHGVVRRYPARTVLVHEGDLSETFFVILDGSVRVYRSDELGRSVTLGVLGRGECFGELAQSGAPRDASVEVIEDATCALIAGQRLRTLIPTSSAVALFVIDVLIRRVHHLSSSVKSLALENVYQRIARLLQGSAERRGELLVVRGRLTHKEIAERIGSSREMVTRVLKELTAGGYLDVGDDQITILKKLPRGW
jgi:CRP/FNR family cyclic AMP-dependent transcriptional regulator